MGIATILAVLSEETESEAALQTALALGKGLQAQVTALHVAIEPERSLPLLGEGMTAAMVADLTASLTAEAKRSREVAEALFTRLCREPGLPVVGTEDPPQPGRFAAALVSESGVEAERVAELGRLHDLIVLARTRGEDGTSSPTLEAALFDTGRPVLVAPLPGLARPPERAVIAWNGSREAARAVSAALPLLKAAKQVTILTGEGRDDSGVAHPTSLARHLAAHGLSCELWPYQPDDRPVAASLVRETQKIGADFLVMGAYGHSRLRELVLGGATRAALKAEELALLMAH